MYDITILCYIEDQNTAPAPFSTRLWLELNPEREPKRLSPTSLLQRGHDALIFSHLSTHSLWKKWEHGSSLSSSLFANFAKQMQQTCHSYNIKSSVLMSITRPETMHHEYHNQVSQRITTRILQESESTHCIFSRDHSFLFCSCSHDPTITSSCTAILTISIFN